MIIIYIYTINTIIDYSYINECNNTFFLFIEPYIDYTYYVCNFIQSYHVSYNYIITV